MAERVRQGLQQLAELNSLRLCKLEAGAYSSDLEQLVSLSHLWKLLRSRD